MPQNLLLFAGNSRVTEDLLKDHDMNGVTLKLSLTDFSHLLDHDKAELMNLHILAPEVKRSLFRIGSSNQGFSLQADCYQAARCQLDLFTNGGSYCG